jgi:hypothetical protein
MTRLRVIGMGMAGILIGAVTASAQSKCPPGQTAMPRKPPTGAFAPGKCVANSDVAANQQLQIHDGQSCPSTLKYAPRKPAGRSCVYWDEPG